MQITFVIVLAVALLTAVVTFSVMGWRNYRRSRILAGKTRSLGVRFTRGDPFDLPRCLGEFAIMSCGHSPRAFNVAYGQVDDWPIRAFDFRYEAGHGPRRLIRHYSVVAIDLQMDSPGVLMWNDADAEHAPLQIRHIDGRFGEWSYAGDSQLARTLTAGAEKLRGRGLSMEIQDGLLILAMPVMQRNTWDYTTWLDDALGISAVLKRSHGG